LLGMALLAVVAFLVGTRIGTWAGANWRSDGRVLRIALVLSSLVAVGAFGLLSWSVDGASPYGTGPVTWIGAGALPLRAGIGAEAAALGGQRVWRFALTVVPMLAFAFILLALSLTAWLGSLNGGVVADELSLLTESATVLSLFCLSFAYFVVPPRR